MSHFLPSSGFHRLSRAFRRGLFALVVLALASPAVAQVTNLGTSSIGEVEYELAGPYTWAADPSTPLPPGLSIRTGPAKAPWFSPTATAGLIGIATTPNTYSFNLLRDGVPVPYTLKITALSDTDNWTSPDAFVGVPYSRQLHADNALGPVTWAANPFGSPLPPGLTVSTSGVISGIPTASGFYSPNFAITDGVDTVYRSISINVYSVRLTTPGILPRATTGSFYSVTLDAAGGTAPYQFTSFSVPGGLVLNTNGTLSGTPTFGGTWNFDVSVVDSLGISYTKRMSLSSLNGVPQLPQMTPYGNLWDDCSLAVACQRGLSVLGTGGPFTYSVSGLPPGMRLFSGEADLAQWMSPMDASLEGSPTVPGIYPVTVTATGADGASTSNTFTLKVKPLWLTNGPAGAFLNEAYSSFQRIIGGTLPYTTSIVDGRLPNGLTLSGETISGTPTENGSYNFVLRVTDAAANTLDSSRSIFVGSHTSTITIGSSEDLGTFQEGLSLNRVVSACCVPSYNWTKVSGTLPTNITLGASTGALVGTPPAGSAGTYTFVLRVADATNAANFAQRQFILRITNVAFGGSFATLYANVGTPFSNTLTASGGTGITYSVEPKQFLPPGITLSSAGVLSGTPTASGFFNFIVRATNAAGASVTRSVQIAVYPSGVAPPLQHTFGGTFTTIPVGVRLYQIASSAVTGGTAPYVFSATPGAPEIAGMRVQNGAPLPTSFPVGVNAGYLGVVTAPGSYTTSTRVSDASGQVFDKSLSVLVTAHNLKTTSPPRATVGLPYSYTLPVTGGIGPFTFTATGMPAGLTLNVAGQITGTPAAGGTSFPSVTVTDVGTGAALPTSITLAVDAFQITSPAILPGGTVNQAYGAQTLTTLGCPGSCTWQVTSGGLPLGLSLTSGGVLSGTPTSVGTSVFTVTASGSGGSTAQKTFALRVAPNPAAALAMSNTTFNDVTVGNVVTNLLSATSGTAPYSWTLTAGSLPPGVDLVASGDTVAAGLGNGAAYLFGRPSQVGLYAFTLRVTDAVGATVTRAFTWRISGLNSQYNSLPLSGTTLVYGAAYTQPLLIVGGTGSYTFSASGMPAGLTVDPSTGVVSGTPAVTGNYSVPVTVTDTGGNVLTTFVSITINGTTGTTLNLSQLTTTIQQGAGLSSTVTVSGGTAPYVFTAMTPLPPGFTLTPGTTSSAVVVNGVGVAPGVYTFTLRATDSAGNVGARAETVTVLPFNLLTNTTALEDGTVGVPYSHQLQTVGAGATWALTSGALPAGVTLSPAGVISGTPTVTGTFSFTVTATNGGSLTQSLSLRISPIAFVADVLPTATAGVPYSYTFTATGGGASKTWTLQSSLPGLNLSSAGVLSGTPTSTGSFTVLVLVSDGTTPIQRRALLPIVNQNLSVLDISTATTALTGVMQGQITSLTLSASGGLPPYSWSVAPGSTLPPGIALYSGTALSPSAFAPGTTLLYGSPTAAGSYAFDLRVTDAAGHTTQRTFTAVVGSIGVTPTALTAPVAGSPYSQQFFGLGGTAPYTFAATAANNGQDALPPGLTLSPAGLLSGTTTSTGTYRFLLTVTDAAGATLTRVFTITPQTSSGRSITLSNLSGFVGNRFSTALSVNASTPPSVTWSIASGALPPGISIVTDPVLTGGGAFLAGQPTTPGVYTYTVRATDVGTPSNTTDRTATIRVTRTGFVFPPQGTSLPTAQVGQPYSAQARVSGGTGPYVFTLSGALDPGFSVDTAGLITAVPLTSGNHPIPLRVTDATGEVYEITLNVTTAAAGAPAPLVAVSAFPEAQFASVGAPYTFALDTLTVGGTGGLSWAITGGSLPPGIDLAPAANGVPAFLFGRATTPGDYSFSATATDATGQTLALTVDMGVADGGLAAASVPHGKVGVPYSVDLAPFGGVPPYTFGIYPFLDAPPGLSISSGGLLSGVPTRAGTYNLGVLANDQLGGEPLLKPYRIVIDDAAGEAPAASISPRPISIYYEQGSAPPSVPVSVASTSGTQAFTLSLSGAPWAFPSASSGSTPTGLSLLVNPSGLPAGVYTGVLAMRAPAAVNVYDAQPVVLTVAPAPPCAYSVSPGSSSTAASGGTGSFSVSAAAACGWTAVASDPWISITSAATSSGSGAVSYAVAANGGASARTGTITVNGATYTITQFGAACSFAISPVSLTVPAGGGSASISITGSSACAGPPAVPWAASGLSASPSSGTGNGTVTVLVPANPDAAARVLTASIGGQTLTITQAGAACIVSLDAASASHGSGGGGGSVAVTTPAGCDYSTVTGPSWVNVTSGGSGTGPGTLVYSVAANSTTFQRTGALTIGGQPFVITQDALACSATLDTGGLSSPYGPGGGLGSVIISMNGSNCAWSAASGAAWASVTPSSGSGSATVLVNLGSNAASTASRSLQLTIAGQTIDLVQAGTTCTFALLSPTAGVPALGAVGSVGVAAPSACGWTATSADPGWLTVTSATASGNGAVGFVAQQNTSSSPRSGTLMIAGVPFTVQQAGAPCSYLLSGTNTTVAAGGAGGSFTFTASAGGCSPAATSYAGWLHAATSFDGSTGTVTFTADANGGGSARSGIMQLGTSSYFVTQLGAACAYSLNTYGALFSSVGAAGNTFLGSPSALGCSPIVGVDLPSIVQLGPTTGPVLNIFTQQYDVNPFTSLTPAIRRARITFGGTIFVVKQTSW